MRSLAISILILVLASTPSPALSRDWQLAWDPVPQATGYKIYFKDNNDTLYNKDVGNITQIKLNDLNIATNVPYTYWVTAYNNACESVSSDTVSFTRPSFVPGEDNLPEVTITIPDGVSAIRIIRDDPPETN